jgi:hypothetical protein
MSKLPGESLSGDWVAESHAKYVNILLVRMGFVVRNRAVRGFSLLAFLKIGECIVGCTNHDSRQRKPLVGVTFL